MYRSGVYKWTNRINGKVYVGSAARGLAVRLREHLRDLAAGKSHNRYLQTSWNKHGREAFIFSVVERCAPQDCTEREAFWVAHYRATEEAFGYNLCEVGNNSLGVKRSEETKERLRNRKLPEGFGDKTAERNRKRVWTPESLAKKAEAARALWKDPVWRAKQVAARLGKKLSEETRKKMSESQIRRHRNRV